MRLHTQLRTLAIALFPLLLAPTVAHAADILVNGDFEADLASTWNNGVSHNTGYTELSGAQLPGWTIESGYSVTIHNTTSYPTISGAYSVNMDGEGRNGHNANLYQDFASASGTSYTLNYDWAIWNTNATPTLKVSVIDISNAQEIYSGTFGGNSAASGVTQHVATSFLGTGNTLRLRIQEGVESGFNDNTFIVDNFSVTAVPEPESYAMLMAGLGILAFATRRRSARHAL